MGLPAVFLDRDGTLIYDTGYLNEPDRVQLIPGAIEAMVSFKKWGYKLVLVSNQSGVGRGFFSQEDMEQVHRRFESELASCGVTLDGAYYCPHAPWSGCLCRKPLPGLLRQAALDLDLDLLNSFMVGDKAVDIEAGRRAGCRTILLNASSSESPLSSKTGANCNAGSWHDVVRFIFSHQEK